MQIKTRNDLKCDLQATKLDAYQMSIVIVGNKRIQKAQFNDTHEVA